MPTPDVASNLAKYHAFTIMLELLLVEDNPGQDAGFLGGT
jgi:hypothetical protein